MKGIFKIVVICGCAVLLTGCGTKVTKCSINNDEGQSGYTLDTTFEIYSSDDKVNKVEVKEVVTSKNNTTLAYFEDKLKKKYQELNDTYGGYTVKSEIKDGKATVTATIDYSKVEIEKFANDNDIIKSDILKANKMTPEIAKKYYESSGASCK